MQEVQKLALQNQKLLAATLEPLLIVRRLMSLDMRESSLNSVCLQPLAMVISQSTVVIAISSEPKSKVRAAKPMTKDLRKARKASRPAR